MLKMVLKMTKKTVVVRTLIIGGHFTTTIDQAEGVTTSHMGHFLLTESRAQLAPGGLTILIVVSKLVAP